MVDRRRIVQQWQASHCNMSTAWYRPGVVPKLVQAWEVDSKNLREFSVEIWETTCIVNNFRHAECQVLINPGNPSLSGVSKFPYFPVRGPEPKVPPNKDAHPIMGHVSQWGGMEVGNGMMFAANVVDGLVHQLGGTALARELEAEIGKRRRLDEGQSIWTSGVGDYAYIIHTVPPFFSEIDTGDTNMLLQKCYKNSLLLALSTLMIEKEKEIRVACPLLGAGCRGFPPDEAIFHFLTAVADWSCTLEGDSAQESGGQKINKMSLVFGIPSETVRKRMIRALDAKYGR
eukprot:scaffold902_cov147-Cylindrotheca_fusiformis.AAC.4